MNENLTMALHCAEYTDGGIYNVLGTFTQGLYKALKKKVNVFPTVECAERKIPLQVALGFNVCCYEVWENILANNIPNVMWSVDSIFAQNYQVIKKFSENPNFIVFTVHLDDVMQAQELMPNLKIAYLPHAVDKNLVQKTNNERNIEAIFTASVFDWEEKLNEIKQTLKPDTFKIVKSIFDNIIASPDVNFFEIYKLYCEKMSLPFNADFYASLYQALLPVVESYFKIKMIKDLKDFPIKIFGSEVWQKFISKKQEYKGKIDGKDCIDLMKQTKIVLHNHPKFFNGGFHERFLNAMGVGSFALLNDEQGLLANFKDCAGFYNNENIAEKFEYYLQNDDERENIAKTAQEYVLKNHTWDNRVDEILKMLN